MAKINESLFSAEGLDKRLNLTKFNQVMMTEYWIPKDINFLWAMGVVLATTFMILIVSGIFLMEICTVLRLRLYF
jgi:ubiquinol-cytochrome c reductase cytochrome b subunit